MRQLIVYPHRNSGLGNRMLTMMSAMRIAKEYDFKFAVEWEAESSSLVSEFHGLFSRPLPEDVASDVPSTSYRIDMNLGLPPISRTTLLDNNSIHISASNVILWQDNGFSNDRIVFGNGVFFQDFMLKSAEYLQEFEPSARVRDLLRLFDRIDFSNVIGVHIRRSRLGDFGDVSPFENVSLKAYLDVMNQLAAENSPLRFFVSSNIESDYSLLQSLYGDRVFFYDKRSLDRTQVEANQDALVDMLLLSRTRMIVRNHYSTFSYVSALWGKVSQLVLYSTSPTTPAMFTLCDILPDEAGDAHFHMSSDWKKVVQRLT